MNSPGTNSTDHPDDEPTPSSRWSGGGLTAGQFALLLVALIVAFFPDVLLGGKTFVMRDFGGFTYPNAYFQRESFWRGEFPLWNPLNNCGMPFLAQWNTVCLYPLSLIYLLLPLTWGLGLFLMFHLFWAGLGMYLLAGQWTQNRLAACIAGIAFAFNGMTLNCLMWSSNLAALAWMPWVILLVERSWKFGGIRRMAIAAIACAVQILAGAPEIIVLTWFILIALGLGRLFYDREIRARIITVTMAVVLTAALLSAAQLLPFLDLLAHSERSSTYGSRLWPIPLWGWANLFVPLFHCYEVPQGIYFQTSQDWTSSYYPGLAVLGLAVAAIICVRRGRVWMLAGFAVFGFVTALGDDGHLYTFLLKLCPPLGFMRYPIKFAFLPVFTLPLLAAYAVAQLNAPPSDKRGTMGKWLMVISGVFVLTVGGILWYARSCPLPTEQWPVLCNNGLLRLGFLVLIFGGLSFLARISAPRQKVMGAVLLLACLWLDFITHVPRQNPTVDSSVFEPGLLAKQMDPTPKLGEARAFMTVQSHNLFYTAMLSDADKDYLGRRGSQMGDCNLLDDIPLTDGFYSLYIRDQRSLFMHFFLTPTNAFPAGLADFLSIAQVSDPEKVLSWQYRASHLPFCSIGAQPVFLELTNILPALLSGNFDPRKVVYLPVEEEDRLTVVTNIVSGTIRQARFSAQRVEAEVEASQPALVVISQTWYHPWRAYVNGQPTRILRANYAFQAIQVPQGISTVKLVYEDKLFDLGLVFSVTTLLGCLGAVWTLSKVSSTTKQQA